MMKTAMSLAMILALAACADAPQQTVQTPEPTFDAFTDIVTADGTITLPENFQTDWDYLGSFAGLADDRNGSKEIHVVYTNPGTIAAYRETGQYPDGAVLVKEVRNAGTEDLTTGRISYATDIKGWFVMIKDRQSRHADSGLWGTGWGWAFYEASETPRLTTTDYQTDCLGCHQPVADQDYSYVQGYPPLKGGN